MIVKKEFKFDAAHRLMSSYTESCQKLHGHSYKVVVEIDHLKLNKDGMVLDFKKLKDLVSPLFELLDHSTIFCDNDQEYLTAFVNYLGLSVTHIENVDAFKSNAAVVTMTENPTAENMAIIFHVIISNIIVKEMPEFLHDIMSIHVFETQTSEAVYTKLIHRSY